MEDTTQVAEETLNTSEAVEPENETQETAVEQTEESSEVVEEVVSKAEYDKLKEIADNQRIRAEKAEKAAKQKAEKPANQQQQSGLAPTDLYALLQANVPQEDVSEVTDYAKLKGISVSEALQSSVVKNILAEKAENRKVQAAANVSTTRRNSGKLSDETLLNTARSKGELPDGDAEIQRLFEARQAAKRGK